MTRTYLDEGEYVPGSPGTALYYGIDQIGSVRRVFSGSGNPAYGYDPYGIPLDATPRVADIGYAGMLTEADSGLSLTPYRAYDANAGRWLSRDPLGESIPEGVNLYQYVLGNPVAFTDPLGLKCDPNPRWPGAGGPGGRPRGGNGGGRDGRQKTANHNEKYTLDHGRYRLNPDYDPDFDITLVQAIAIPPLAGAVAALAPLIPGALGPSGSVFGDTAFGATSQGYFNSSFFRVGFGRGLGQANFRIGYGSYKIDLFSVSIPK